jgi:hypothetical protein
MHDTQHEKNIENVVDINSHSDADLLALEPLQHTSLIDDNDVQLVGDMVKEFENILHAEADVDDSEHALPSYTADTAKLLSKLRNVHSLQTTCQRIDASKSPARGNLEGVNCFDKTLSTEIKTNIIGILSYIVEPPRKPMYQKDNEVRLVLPCKPRVDVLYALLRYISIDFFTRSAYRQGYTSMLYTSLKLVAATKYMPIDKIGAVYADTLALHNGVYQAYIKCEQLLDRVKNKHTRKNKTVKTAKVKTPKLANRNAVRRARRAAGSKS